MAPTMRTEFDQRTDPLRRELLAHCYRMLGSVHDAEDLVQETLLRAWRAYERFDDERASIRTWLHRIATNACLNALETRQRRPLPSGLGSPGDDPTEPFRHSEVPWLQPIPDTMLGADPSDPAAVVAARRTLRLAFLAALQHLPARQRAVLILREVLDWPAADVADVLETTTAAVNSALQRARARLAELSVAVDDVDEPTDQHRRELADRFVAAFEHADLDELARLLTEDALLEMPPMLNWYVGRDRYRQFVERVFRARGRVWRTIPAPANGQPAFAAYAWEDNQFRLHTLQVLSVSDAGVSRNTVYMDKEVFEIFGLPLTLA